ncbi:MAG: hypothetical protein ACXWVJ_09305, partial [Caulobacteraceae bacterium]
YISGLSMNRTGKLLGVSAPTIQAWLEQFAKTYAQKPEPEGRAVVIELDEMWHYLKKSLSSSGSGRLGIVLRGGSWTGNAAVVTRPLASACWSGWPKSKLRWRRTSRTGMSPSVASAPERCRRGRWGPEPLVV